MEGGQPLNEASALAGDVADRLPESARRIACDTKESGQGLVSVLQQQAIPGCHARSQVHATRAEQRGKAEGLLPALREKVLVESIRLRWLGQGPRAEQRTGLIHGPLIGSTFLDAVNRQQVPRGAVRQRQDDQGSRLGLKQDRHASGQGQFLLTNALPIGIVGHDSAVGGVGLSGQYLARVAVDGAALGQPAVGREGQLQDNG